MDVPVFNYDSILARIGDLGRYQKWQYVHAGVFQTFSAIISMSVVFIAASPRHMCSPSVVAPISNTSTIVDSNSNIFSLYNSIRNHIDLNVSDNDLTSWFVPPTLSGVTLLEGESFKGTSEEPLFPQYSYACCVHYVYGNGELAYHNLLHLMRDYLLITANYTSKKRADNSTFDTSLANPLDVQRAIEALKNWQVIHKFIADNHVPEKSCSEWHFSDLFYSSTIISKVCSAFYSLETFICTCAPQIVYD